MGGFGLMTAMSTNKIAHGVMIVVLVRAMIARES